MPGHRPSALYKRTNDRASVEWRCVSHGYVVCAIGLGCSAVTGYTVSADDLTTSSIASDAVLIDQQRRHFVHRFGPYSRERLLLTVAALTQSHQCIFFR